MKNKIFDGFTLAEVLITLGVISVVSVLTIPTLIGNYQKQQSIVELKKVYTELSQAVKMSEIKNGSLESWDYTLSSTDFYNKYLKDYIKVIQVYENTVKPMNIDYKYTNGAKVTNLQYLSPQTLKVILANGSLLAITPSYNDLNFKLLYVDTNGFKKPNQYGKDFFLLTLQPGYGITPYGYGKAYENRSFGNEYTRSIITDKSNIAACTKNQQGQWCTALLISDGWQIKDDYPW